MNIRAGYFDLQSRTRRKTHILFDPSSLPELESDKLPALKRWVLSGNAILYRPDGNGYAEFRVYFGEEPSQSLQESAATEPRLLRVPSGQLVAIGADFLDEVRAGDKAENRFGTAIELTPGNYRVQILEDLGGGEREAIIRAAGMWGYRLVGLVVNCGILALATGVGVIIALFYGLKTWNWSGTLAFLMWAVPIFLLLLAFACLMEYTPIMKRVNAATKEFSEAPEIWIYLVQLEDAEISEMSGAMIEMSDTGLREISS